MSLEWTGTKGGLIGVENPVPHVGDGELQVYAEAVRGRAEAAGAPVVDRRDGDAQIRGQLADIDQGLQAPRVVCGCMKGVHVGQVVSLLRSEMAC